MPFALPLLQKEIPCFLITAEAVILVMSSPSASGFQFTWIMEVRAGDTFLWLCFRAVKTAHLFSQFRGKVSSIICLLSGSKRLTELSTSDQFNIVRNTMASGRLFQLPPSLSSHDCSPCILFGVGSHSSSLLATRFIILILCSPVPHHDNFVGPERQIMVSPLCRLENTDSDGR